MKTGAVTTSREALAQMHIRFYDGDMFPTEAEKARSRETENNYSLYRGRFGDVLRYFRTPEEKKNQLEVIQNVAGKLSRSFAFLMFTEEVKINVLDENVQARINDFKFRNEFDNRMDESALTQSYGGRAYFEMYLKDGLAYFSELNPACVFPQYSTMNANGEPTKIIISWEVKIDEKSYRFIKTHTVGFITYELRKLSTENGEDEGAASLAILDPLLPDVTLGQYEATELDYIPVYWVDNIKTGRNIFGMSDYDDLRSLFEDLTRNQSQIATQLKKHASAKMAVPVGVLDEFGKVRTENTEMFEVPSEKEDGMVIPQYIVNANPLIDSAFKEQEKILEAIARVADISTLLMDWNVTGGAEKVGALKLRILPTLAKVKRKLRPYRRVITDMMVDAMEWEGVATLQPSDVTLEFNDGLPSDPLEDTQVETLRMNAGIQTVEDAVRNLDKLEGEQLATKVQMITDAKAAAPPAFAFTIEHRSIGANVNKIEVQQEEQEAKRKEIIDRFVITPWHHYGIDQLSVWFAWVTVCASVFLYCTVKAVALAVS